MKRLLLFGLSAFVAASAMISPANAQMTGVNAEFPDTSAALGMQVTPFNLVFLAYQGFFESEGISMAANLINGYDAGQITAQDLVEAAIKMNRLSTETLSDRGYLSAVTRQLNALSEDSD
ncbi:MAG: hypothetical protein KME15_17650 [Drouetiella hepatica Uher 2000/2452]|jgi:hypothetical protein|uniref:Uncharacterized protein n=1 Tax=Drouetiella hepatica Uher 2000/2452 TaxID=904376 RepID=A0A951UNI8_9CYAN|nr:hypothetical protein [Drouetiella hepatica Uher 2000/2452]